MPSVLEVGVCIAGRARGAGARVCGRVWSPLALTLTALWVVGGGGGGVWCCCCSYTGHWLGCWCPCGCGCGRGRCQRRRRQSTQAGKHCRENATTNVTTSPTVVVLVARCATHSAFLVRGLCWSSPPQPCAPRPDRPPRCRCFHHRVPVKLTARTHTIAVPWTRSRLL